MYNLQEYLVTSCLLPKFMYQLTRTYKHEMSLQILGISLPQLLLDPLL